MKTCDVSVIIPTYNRTHLLRRALKSVAAQTILPKEIIVIDDCSDTNVVEEVKAIVYEMRWPVTTKLLINETNRGANFSRNRGIFIAAGRYLAFLDSDDLWMPEKLATQMAAIAIAAEENSQPILSGTGRYRVDSNGAIIARQFGGRVFNEMKIRHSNFIGTLSSTIVETWIARHIWGFNEALSACQDWDFFIRLGAYVQYVGVPDFHCVYVDHDDERITLNNNKRLKSHIFIYRTHLRPYLNRANFPSQFYRNVAEDYQQIGNERKANIFLAKSVSIYLFRNEILRKIGMCFFRCFYACVPPKNIRRQRYARYRRMMKRMMKDAIQRDRIISDQKIIESMIGGSEGV